MIRAYRARWIIPSAKLASVHIADPAAPVILDIAAVDDAFHIDNPDVDAALDAIGDNIVFDDHLPWLEVAEYIDTVYRACLWIGAFVHNHALSFQDHVVSSDRHHTGLQMIFIAITEHQGDRISNE